MTTSGPEPTGRRAFDATFEVFDRITALMSAIGTVGILFIMGLITADVVGRAFLDRPIAGVPEIVSMLILSIVFLQIANTLLRDKMTRSDGFLQLLQLRAPRLAGVLDAAMHLAGATLLGILVYAFYPLFMRSYGRSETIGTIGQFIAPIWPTHFVVLLGSAALCLAFLLRAARILIVTFDSRPSEKAGG